MKKLVFFLFALLGICLSTFSQQLPVYSHYFADPYLYNPSFVGSNGYTELNLTHRQQWVGLNDAPISTNFNIQFPLGEALGLGFNVNIDDTGGAFSTMSFATSLAYSIRFSPASSLSFGLGVGAGRNSIDLDLIDPNDPVFVNALDQSFYLEGQFGLNLQVKGLNVAFALPRLFESTIQSESDFQDIGFAGVETTFSSISYHFDLGPNLGFRPMAIYRTNDRLDDQFEGNAAFYFKELLWVGGGYRMDYGATAFLGINISNLFKVGYAYDFASDQVSNFTDGTHEFHLNIRLGKDKKEDLEEEEEELTAMAEEPIEEEPEPEPEPVEPEPEPVVEPVVEPEPEPVVEEPIVEEPEEDIFEQQTEQPEIQEILVNEHIVRLKQGEDPKELGKGNYVVVGAFSVKLNSENHKNQIIEAGYDAKVGFNSKTGLNYVIVFDSGNLLDARVERDKFRGIDKFEFPDTWILRIE